MTDRPGTEWQLVVVGATCGLAWAAGLRGFMTQIDPASSEVHWAGTFVWILLPGVLIGALLGLAEHRRRTGDRRHWQWFVAAPLLFAAVLFSRPWDMGGLFEDGVGGGAIGVPVYAMLGGYALAGGRRWARVLAGLVALTAIPIWAYFATDIGGASLAVNTPRGAWVALYYYAFLAVLALGCAIPHRTARITL